MAALWDSWSTPWAARRPRALGKVGLVTGDGRIGDMASVMVIGDKKTDDKVTGD